MKAGQNAGKLSSRSCQVNPRRQVVVSLTLQQPGKNADGFWNKRRVDKAAELAAIVI